MVINALISLNRLEVTSCDPPPNNGVLVIGVRAAQAYPAPYGNLGPDKMQFDRGYLDRRNADLALPTCATRTPSYTCNWLGDPWISIASVIAHELSHRHGFGHDCASQTPSNGVNMPHIISLCTSQVGFDAAYSCGFHGATCGSSGNGRWMTSTYGGTSCVCVEPGCFDFTDTDHDGVGDGCDACPYDSEPDLDGDGKCSTDNCPFVYNPMQEDPDGDGLGSSCDTCPGESIPDIDRDGVCSGDSCPETWNPIQSNDLDLDGVGDPCDEDVDGDGKLNGADNCPYDANQNQKDSDGDGAGDACDCASFVFGGPSPGCSSVAIRWQSNLELDRRLVAIARALEGIVPGPYGSWEDLAECKWPCPGYVAQDSSTYAAAREYTIGFFREEGITEQAIYRILGSDSRVTEGMIATLKNTRFRGTLGGQ